MASDDLGTRIRRAREAKDMSQEELAARVNRGVRSVGRWERGEAVPKNALGALEVVLAPYFTADGEPPRPPTDPRERELYDLAIQDMDAAGAWAVVEEYRRRKRTRAMPA